MTKSPGGSDGRPQGVAQSLNARSGAGGWLAGLGRSRRRCSTRQLASCALRRGGGTRTARRLRGSRGRAAGAELTVRAAAASLGARLGTDHIAIMFVASIGRSGRGAKHSTAPFTSINNANNVLPMTDYGTLNYAPIIVKPIFDSKVPYCGLAASEDSHAGLPLLVCCGWAAVLFPRL